MDHVPCLQTVKAAGSFKAASLPLIKIDEAAKLAAGLDAIDLENSEWFSRVATPPPWKSIDSRIIVISRRVTYAK